MKKIIALMLVMLLAFSLVGCKSKGYSDDEEIAIPDVEHSNTTENQSNAEASDGEQQPQSEKSGYEEDVIPDTAVQENLPDEQTEAETSDNENEKNSYIEDSCNDSGNIIITDSHEFSGDDSYTDDYTTSQNSTPQQEYETIGPTGVRKFKSVSEILAASDYVVVASPTQDYTEAEQCWYTYSTEPTDDFDKASFSISFCVRPFKITEVIKGPDKSLTEINICQNILTNNGETRILTGNYRMNPDTKYLIFLYKSETNEEQYFPFLFQGVYTFDHVTDAELWQTNPTLYDEIENRFADKIKKEVD